jgi:hypothetical protein
MAFPSTTQAVTITKVLRRSRVQRRRGTGQANVFEPFVPPTTGNGGVPLPVTGQLWPRV